MNLKKNIFNAITIILLAALIAGAVLLNNRIKKLETQMSYTSDNTSVILSDVQTMQDDIKSTLEEEASLITDWDISLKSADFTDMTYTVSVSVVPKEYTEDTKTSVFFGTNEIPLELNGIKYTGEATLPLSEDYAGNVTFLFVDGNKRSTEVLDEFEGVTSVFKNVASGILADKPTFDNGSIKLGTDVDVAVMGNDYFDFNSVQLDASKEDDGKLHSLEGTVKIEDLIPVTAASNIKIYVKAVSAQGYTFTYDLFDGIVNQDITDFETTADISGGDYTVTDPAGSKYEP